MKINSRYHWQVKLYQVKVDDTFLALTSKKIIFDSGSSLIYLPSQEYNVFMNAVFISRE